MGNHLFEIISIIIFALFSYLTFRIFKKIDKPKIGKLLSLVVFLILTVDSFMVFWGVRWGVGFWLMLFILYTYISFSIFLVLKKDQKPITGKLLSIVVFLLLTGFTLKEVYKDELFTKKDAREILIKCNIILNNDFELIDNESMSAIGDYHHLFKLKISNEDRVNIINHIKADPSFNKDTLLVRQIENRMDYQSNSIRILNYETDCLYTKMELSASPYPRMASWLKISIHKHDNILIYEEFDE